MFLTIKLCTLAKCYKNLSESTTEAKEAAIQRVGWVLWHINLCRLFNAKSIFMQIVSSISNNSVYHEYKVCQKQF